jgi:hypothetical protein
MVPSAERDSELVTDLAAQRVERESSSQTSPAGRGAGWSQTLLTVLTVLTVFS